MRDCNVLRSLRNRGTVVAVVLVALGSASGCAVGSSSDDAAPGGASDGGVTTYTGEGTFYASVSSGGNCSFGNVGTRLFGAMNHTDYAGSAACGACAKVSGPNGEVTVLIVDQCPECAPGDIDLSQDAFARLAPLSQGRIPISWSYVPCDVQGPIHYHFKEGSSQWWTGVQLRNHTNAIARFEYLSNGQFVTVPRMDYNYFIASSGMGPGPYTFRLTDVHGAVLTDVNVPLILDQDIASPGNQQFPASSSGT